MTDLLLYHNPRCSKSRALLTLLRQKGLAPELLLYLQNPPDPDQLQLLADKLSLPVRSLLRSSEKAFKSLDLGRPEITDAELLKAVAEHPELLQRPILIAGNRAAIGRPPEAALALLEED